MALWLVRAGKHGEREDLALEEGLVAIGWDELPDLSSAGSPAALREMLDRTYADSRPNTRRNWQGQLWGFLRRMEADDLVLIPLRDRSAVAVGRVTDRYEYRTTESGAAHHVRAVEWLRTDLPKSALDEGILASLHFSGTVARIVRDHAEERVMAAVEGRQTPETTSGQGQEADGGDETLIDVESYARDLILKHVSERFTEHGLERLVAALLEAQGYLTKATREGPDGGVDILAGRGPMGFDPPRLCVHVKSGDQPADVKVLRELQGVMKGFGADQGLFVSWGGFRSSVYAESRRLFFEIRLWDAGDVVEELLRYYEQLPDDLKAELPLKRIWTLVPEEE